jgi:transposase
MYRIRLTGEQRVELRRRAQTAGVAPRERERMDMVRLSDAGWSVPRIARHLGWHEQTVRKYVAAFLAGGFERLADRPRPGRPRRLTDEHLAALERLLDATERSWTRPQLVAWLRREHGVSAHPDSLRVLLKRRRFRWKRTKRSVRHKGDPDRRAAAELELARLKRRARLGQIDLWYLDQAGFAPTLPTGYTWARIGVRKVVRYEAPEGRRVNAVGALAPHGPGGPRLVFETRRKEQGRYDAAAHLRFVREAVAGLPAGVPIDSRRPRPCVIVLDNYAVHRGQVVKDELPTLRAQGITFYFLPPYSPELNAIEPLWRQVKYQDLPDRSYPTAEALQHAVEDALTTRAGGCCEYHIDLPRSA